jgi:NAD-dependent deacetylase
MPEDIDIAPDQIPRCGCGGQIRPDVVWFGEMLPAGALETAHRKAAECGLFLSIGTSAVVYPAAQLPFAAKSGGAYLVEINPTPTPVTSIADEVFTGPSGVVLPLIWQTVMG